MKLQDAIKEILNNPSQWAYAEREVSYPTGTGYVRVIVDRSTKILYQQNGLPFIPSFEDISSESWELKQN